MRYDTSPDARYSPRYPARSRSETASRRATFCAVQNVPKEQQHIVTRYVQRDSRVSRPRTTKSVYLRGMSTHAQEKWRFAFKEGITNSTCMHTPVRNTQNEKGVNSAPINEHDTPRNRIRTTSIGINRTELMRRVWCFREDQSSLAKNAAGGTHGQGSEREGVEKQCTVLLYFREMDKTKARQGGFLGYQPNHRSLNISIKRSRREGGRVQLIYLVHLRLAVL